MTAWQEYFEQMGAMQGQVMAQRRAINAVYAARLPGEIQLPAAYALWRFNILAACPQSAISALSEAGLFATAPDASLAGVFAPGECPHAASLTARAVNLFNNHRVTPEMAEKMCDILLSRL